MFFPNPRRIAGRDSSPETSALGFAAFPLRSSARPLSHGPPSLGLLSRLWDGWRSALLIVRPETVIAWHRRGFRLCWQWKSRTQDGPPCSAQPDGVFGKDRPGCQMNCSPITRAAMGGRLRESRIFRGPREADKRLSMDSQEPVPSTRAGSFSSRGRRGPRRRGRRRHT